MILGETKTAFLQNSTSVSLRLAAELLVFRPDVGTLQSERPIALATSSDVLTGVNCHLPSARNAKVEAIGTVISRASIVGGAVVQGTAYSNLVPSTTKRRRMPWPHYLSSPGQIETNGKFRTEDVELGFLDFSSRRQDALAIGAIAESLTDRVQQDARLDHKAPFKAQRTSVRWIFHTQDPMRDTEDRGSVEAHFRLEGPTNRILRVRDSSLTVSDCVRVCESVAYHDWLLSTLLRRVESAGLSDAGTRAIDRLRPTLEHLNHLWMPRAHLSLRGASFWDSFEHSIDFSRQWNTAVDHIRDLMFIELLDALSKTTSGEERVK